jgi:hypothetical protein
MTDPRDEFLPYWLQTIAPLGTMPQPSWLPTSAQIRGVIEPFTGQFYESQTVAGDYARTVGEFVPGMAAPGGVAKNAVRYVVAPALASEYAGQSTQGTWMEPWARAIAALATGGVGAALDHLPGALRAELTELANSLSGKMTSMYPPPPKGPRPFSADYPGGALTDASGRLLADIEARPLTAKYIAGRRVAGGEDVGLIPIEIWDLVKRITGRHPEEYAPKDMMPDQAGVYLPSRDRKGNAVRPEIGIRNDLPDQEKRLVLGHETGHLLHDISTGMSSASLPELAPELAHVYSTLNTGIEGVRPPRLPQHFGYPYREVPDELFAEAFRAYLTDPNYFKTVAPHTAAAIRGWVNSHPVLSKWIQFNSIGGLAAVGAAKGDAPDDQSGI